MEEFVILQSPAALLLCGAALFLCLFDRLHRASRGWLTVLSAASDWYRWILNFKLYNSFIWVEKQLRKCLFFQNKYLDLFS